MSDLLQIKRGNKPQLPALMQGEPAFCMDEEKLYVGGVAGNVCISSASKIGMTSGKSVQAEFDFLKTTGNLTYFVRSDGSDSNNGLTNTIGGAFKTIAKAISMIPQIVNHTVTINVAFGTYLEDAYLCGFWGKGKIEIYGDNVASENVNVRSLKIENCTLYVYCVGINFTNTTNYGVKVERSSDYLFNLCKCVAVGAYDGFWFTSTFGTITNCVISNRSNAINSQLGMCCSMNNSGVANNVGLSASVGGTIAKAGSQPNGTTPELIATGGVIR